VPQISLTDLVDIVSRSGSPKATKVAQVKARPDYEPAFDFYKSLRDRIIDIHRAGEPRAALTTFMGSVTDPKKRKNYPTAVSGYKKWWGQKTLEWFTPLRTTYTQSGVDVIINPELGLDINGRRHLVKLYFKNDSLSVLRIDIITRLMENRLRPLCQQNEVMAVLDVRNAKLFPFRSAATASMAMIDAELAYIASLWPQV
jgi:hypothetical protein